MKHAVWVSLLLLVGCVQPNDTSTPTPQQSLDSAAHDTAKLYITLLGDGCDSLASRLEAGEFKAEAQVVDEWGKISADAKQKSFQSIWEPALDKAVPPNGKFNPAAEAKMYRKSAAGFRRAVK